MRIGFSSDIHRLVEGRKLILAGVIIPSKVGELAHSDGDVVFHALSEAVLGALALGDLGKHFPDNDKNSENMDSGLIVEYCYNEMIKKGYLINNVDISITLETPKLRDYIQNMRKNVADLLHTAIENVSIKAGTNEKIDEIGKGLAVKAECILLLKKKEVA